MDTLQAVLYTTKRRGNQHLADIAESFLMWEKSISVWVNHKKTKRPFEKKAQRMNNKEYCAFLSYELYNTFPTTPEYQDHGLLLAAVFDKGFVLKGLGLS